MFQKDVSVNIDGNIIEISGKNGTHSHHFHENIKINLNDNIIKF